MPVEKFKIKCFRSGCELAADFAHFKKVSKVRQAINRGIFSDFADDLDFKTGFFFHFPACSQLRRFSRIDPSAGKNPDGNISALD